MYKKVLSSIALASLLVTISACNNSDSVKKVYLNKNGDQGKSKNSGNSLKENSTNDNQDNNETASDPIDITIDMNDILAGNALHISMGSDDYEILSIQGNDSAKFEIIAGDLNPKQDIENGTYDVTVVAKKVGGSDEIEQDLKISIINGVEVDSGTDDNNSSTDNNTTDSNTTDTNTSTSTQTLFYGQPGDDRYTYQEALDYCKQQGYDMPTYDELSSHEQEVRDALKDIDSDYDDSNGKHFYSVVWSSTPSNEAGKILGYYIESDTKTDSIDINKSDKYFFTCIKK